MTSLKLLKAISDIDDKYVLEAMPSQFKEEKKRIFNFKLVTSSICVLVVGIVGFELIKNNISSVNNVDTVAVSDETAIREYTYLEDSTDEILDFDFNTPNLEFDKEHLIVANEIIEVDYYDDNKLNVLTLRKAKSSEDISGDYSTYEVNEDVNIENILIHVKYTGNEILITFIKGEYSYSLYSDNLSKDKAIEIVSYIIENN